MKSLTDTFKLSNGVEIPCIGFGTWQTPDGETAIKAVKAAFDCGYRHIDAAAIYGNEESVGEAMAESGVKREDYFVTSKLWNDEHGYDSTLRAFDQTMKDLRLDYLDLYLIHWPVPVKFRDDWESANAQTWRAFEKLYEEKRIRAIGISNFLPHHIQALKKTANIMPMVNQIEYHPAFMQKDVVDFSEQEGMLIEAYSPLGTGAMLDHPVLKEIAEKYGKSTAHVCIRWILQHGVLPLPKSVTPSRIEDNTKVFDFELSAEDMAKIDGLPEVMTGSDPDHIDF